MNLGQYWTPDNIVTKMVALMQNHGTILEPSCGNGAFLKQLPKNTVALDVDERLARDGVIIQDFFAYNPDFKFDTIIGNPPYVKYQEISETTKKNLPNVLDQRSNLYLFFMWHSIDLLADNGELIFIVPRDFLKTTSARTLNQRFVDEGTFTYFEEFGDEKVFPDVDPNVCIFRWVKTPGAETDIKLSLTDGYITFGEQKNHPFISSLFDVKTGGVSGCNEIYYQPTGNIDVVISTTKRTGITQRAILATEPTEYLLQFKDRLLARGVRSFNENNWFEWGRKLNEASERHIYVNTKTRDLEPFFYHPCKYYDGSLLGLMCKSDNHYDLDYLIYCLNHNDWAKQGFQVGGRLIFGQRNLSNAYLILR